MNWLMILNVILIIQTSTTQAQNRRKRQNQNVIKHFYKNHNNKFDITSNEATQAQLEQEQQQQHYADLQQLPENDDYSSNNNNNNNNNNINNYNEFYNNKAEAEVFVENSKHRDKSEFMPTVEIDIGKCPQGCVCQYAHLMDLPISRWISHMHLKHQRVKDSVNYFTQTNKGLGADHADHDDDDEDSNNAAEGKEQANENNASTQQEDDNETYFVGDLSYLTNPFVKQATCIIQEDTNSEQLMESLPHDIQALILLYTGVGKNKTVNSSILKSLNQLTTLEVRGSQDRALKFVLDYPLQFLQHANFESITLMGSEDIVKKSKSLRHPKEAFNYKPNIELLNSMELNEATSANYARHYDEKILTELQQKEREEEMEIVPYEVYIEEVKRAKMPTFYGWKSLEVLRIQECGLRNDLSWEMFMGLEELQHLSLQHNDIEIIPPFALSGAKELKTLSLAHNKIQDLHYRNLAGLFELEALDLSDNRLMKLTELTFPPLPKLKKIDFRFNPIRYIFPATFWVMNQTEELYFGSAEVPLELWGNQPFKKLTKLRELHVNNVSIQNLEQNILKDLNSLQKLKLHGDVTSIEFDAFTGFDKLEELDMSQCNLQEISMDAFIGCKQLKLINLANNQLSYIPPGLFDDQQQVQEIYLNNNQLRSLPKTFFQQHRLKLARLNENPWKCSCDMFNWKAKITNQEKAQPLERCVKDYLSGKELSCRKVENYKFDRKYAPRCDNFKGRSVFYVLRKQLQCNTKYIQFRTKRVGQRPVQGREREENRRGPPKSKPHWLKVEERRQKLNGTLANASVYSVDNPITNRLLWQVEKAQKIEKTLKSLNADREWRTRKALQDLVEQRKQQDIAEANKLTAERLRENLDMQNQELSNNV